LIRGARRHRRLARASTRCDHGIGFGPARNRLGNRDSLSRYVGEVIDRCWILQCGARRERDLDRFRCARPLGRSKQRSFRLELCG
jgi:hypothetical protein